MKKYLLLLAATVMTATLAGCFGNCAPYTPELYQITPNTYGHGVHSNQYGQPVRWEVQGGHQQVPGEYLQVNPNAYGPGIGMDQYGRPVKLVPAY
jgi:hypothetical protein